IQTLNNTFRQIDKPTDVLSFPNFNFVKGQGVSPKEISENISIDDKLAPLGDIAICAAVAKAQAKEYGHSYKREVCFLALHGFLHLLGYDHLTPEDETEMQALAKEVLEMEKVKR
ncbi:MAG: rRNA maturation RNase YbeY, partial [Clostridia bacterium]